MANTQPRKRTLARQLAVQGLYKWQMLKSVNTDELIAQLPELLGQDHNVNTIDKEHLTTLIDKIPARATELDELLSEFIDRDIDTLDPIEHAILRIGAYEMTEIKTPASVMINEAIELAKVFGGSDGHKFVNGVLDKLAKKIANE